MRLITLSLGALALAGCAGREHPVPIGDYQTVTAPQPRMPSAAPADYRINALDVIRINIFGEPELSFEQLTVSPTGKVQLPIIGEVQVEGRTTDELSRQIATLLNHYLREPQVTVNVVTFVSQKVTVTGAVRAPGVYQALGQMSLMDAVAMGQGVDNYSKLDEIVVFRREGGQRYVARFDLASIQRGEAADPTILPGDTVVVGYSESRRFFSDSLAVLPAAVGIFLALIN